MIRFAIVVFLSIDALYAQDRTPADLLKIPALRDEHPIGSGLPRAGIYLS
jgi:hypothetical protein